MGPVPVQCPIENPDVLMTLTAGTRVSLSGTLLTARDAAHERLYQLHEQGLPLPVTLENQVIYYVGPGPARPGAVVGSSGPTTASRMDRYTPLLLSLGVKATIGKGYRSDAVKAALVYSHAVYFGAVGGLGALLSRSIIGQRVVAFEELGPEAIRELTVKDFPAIVLIDAEGRDFYQLAQQAYRQE